jgi:hypothetical protein
VKVAHWTFLNGSGLSNMAVDICSTEALLGSESVLCNTADTSTWGLGMDADIHVVHSHIPDSLSFDKSKKLVVVEHGSPEHVFEKSVTDGLKGNYGPSDSLAMLGFFLKRADAVVSFWPRQSAIWENMTNAKVYTIPMGVDKEFWKPVQKQNLLTGNPAILTGENCHTCKWPLDLMIMWPNIVKMIPEARVHFINIPYDQHMWWVPLSYMTGTRYTTYMTATKLGKENLRNFFCASNFYYSPVQYGDHNRVCLEAAACGAKVISYKGNQYSHYWITEGDQREQTKELLDILSGNVTERKPLDVPAIEYTASLMIELYKELV